MQARESHAPTPRRGLAPLELVLSLPLLMMMFALIVIMGSAGAWKVRADANSRQAILRAVYPRTTDSDPHPLNWWPASASMTYHDGGSSFLAADPYAAHTAIRGPWVTSPESGTALRVLTDTMDMTLGMRSGQADINHDPPMWGRLGVRNDFTRENIMFAGQTWQYGNLGIPSNSSRRILHQYDYELSKYNPVAAARTQAARQAILTNPNRQALMVLDRDAELRAWYFHNFDFHPQPGGCTYDPTEIQTRILPGLLNGIDNVPETMTNRFLRMYYEQLAALEAMNPPPPDYAQQKADLETKIRQLEEFAATL
jgi:hypothetical protein